MESAAPPVEVEVKLRLADPAGARATLLAAGARHLGTGTEEDLFFLHPCRDLAARDEALRLRRTPSGLELTFKGPRSAHPGVKARTELTLALALASDPAGLLAALGFRPGPRVWKRRDSFALDGLTVTLDEVDGIGWYAEVEARGQDAQAGTRQVEALLARLGWTGWPREHRAYVTLVEDAP